MCNNVFYQEIDNKYKKLTYIEKLDKVIHEQDINEVKFYEIADKLFKRVSGTSTMPMFGSIVQNGKFSACAFFDEVKALNNVDFPTFGRPTIPHLNPIQILINFT